MVMDRPLSHWRAELRHERMVLGGSMWKFQRKWLFFLRAFSLWLSAASASQAEGMYQISEGELMILEQDLHQLTEASQQWM